MKKVLQRFLLLTVVLLGSSNLYSQKISKADLEALAGSTIVNNLSPTQLREYHYTLIDSVYDDSTTTHLITESSDFGTPVGGFYEVIEGSYKLACGMTLDYPIKWVTPTGNYSFEGSNINCTLTYNGTESMFQTAATNIVVNIKNLVFIAPNAEAITFTDGNSLILTNISLGVNCKKVATITDTSFLTCDGFAMVGCDDGITCTNVDSLSITNTQWSSGTGSNGKAFSLNGTASQALFSIVNYQAAATENMIYIDNSYGGLVSISNGAFTSNGGNFFDATGRDGTHPSVNIQDVIPVSDSSVESYSHSAGGTTTTIGAGNQGVAIKVNAVWSDNISQRIGTNTNGTWTYTGLEDTNMTINCALGVDPQAINQKLTGYVYKNGVFAPDSDHQVDVNRGGQVIIFFVVPMSTGDYIEIYISNDSSINNIDMLNSSLKLGWNCDYGTLKNTA